MKRVFLIVLDSMGVGEMPDAWRFHDEGSNTLGAIAAHENFSCPTLTRMGLFAIDGVKAPVRGGDAVGLLDVVQGRGVGNRSSDKPHRLLRLLRQARRALGGEGYHHRPLGDRRGDFRNAHAPLSQRFSARNH